MVGLSYAIQPFFIFCVNVFEHVDDWRHFLDWASKNLNENGQFIVLCPNYGIPYESHFKIPIIFNKRLRNCSVVGPSHVSS